MDILLIAITAVAIFGPSPGVGPIFSQQHARYKSGHRESSLELVLLPGMAPVISGLSVVVIGRSANLS